MRALLNLVIGFCALTGAAAIYVEEYDTAVFILVPLLGALLVSRYI